MAYATVSDVEARTTHTYTTDEESVISTLLDDAAVLIDIYNANATDAAKLIVSQIWWRNYWISHVFSKV